MVGQRAGWDPLATGQWQPAEPGPWPRKRLRCHGGVHEVRVVYRPTSSSAANFLGRTRAVQVVPYDQHLSEGSHIDLDLLGDRTRRAFVELAATVADSFPTTARRLR